MASPWKVVSCDFDPVAKSLELVLDFERGARFTDPETGVLCPVHDTVQRSWEHLKFFEHRTTIHARVPRITTPSGLVKTVEVPWARPNGGFTLLMEAYLLVLAKAMLDAEVSRQTSVSEDRIWHLIRTRINEAWLKADWSSINRLGVDETSTRKGHKYGTVFLEISGKETERGRGASKVAREQSGLPRGAMWALRGNPENLKEEQRNLREQICKEYGKIARALSIREFLADLWNYQLRDDAKQHLESVISWCSRSRMQPFVKLGKTLKKHMDGILGYFNNYTTSTAIEAVNGLLQLARRRARGYRTFRNFQAMAYWIAGGLTIETRPVPTH